MLAKIQGAKRKRAEDEDMDMDEDDEEEGSDEGEENWMDVDGEESSKKRLKTNSGGAVNKREPRSHRHLAGLRDEVVSFEVLLLALSFILTILLASGSCSQATQPRSETTQYAGESRRGRSCDQDQNGKFLGDVFWLAG